MIVFRLCKNIYAKDFSGKGAEMSGGRWNSKGVQMIYTSESRALCTTEIAVHTPLGILPTNFEIISIEIPSTIKIKEIPEKDFPENWNSISPIHSTQIIGDAFIQENLFLVFKVPSAVVSGDYNFLINPRHKDIDKVKKKSIEKFSFDARLFLK